MTRWSTLAKAGSRGACAKEFLLAKSSKESSEISDRSCCALFAAINWPCLGLRGNCVAKVAGTSQAVEARPPKPERDYSGRSRGSRQAKNGVWRWCPGGSGYILMSQVDEAATRNMVHCRVTKFKTGYRTVKMLWSKHRTDNTLRLK